MKDLDLRFTHVESNHSALLLLEPAIANSVAFRREREAARAAAPSPELPGSPDGREGPLAAGPRPSGRPRS